MLTCNDPSHRFKTQESGHKLLRLLPSVPYQQIKFILKHSSTNARLNEEFTVKPVTLKNANKSKSELRGC